LAKYLTDCMFCIAATIRLALIPSIWMWGRKNRTCKTQVEKAAAKRAMAN
jgi:hypothetical protein